MSAVGKFFITPHAVRRFMERGYLRGATYEAALAEMIKLADRAHYVKPLRDGVELWRTGAPGRWRLRIGRGNSGLPQVLTIMQGHDRAAP